MKKTVYFIHKREAKCWTMSSHHLWACFKLPGCSSQGPKRSPPGFLSPWDCWLLWFLGRSSSDGKLKSPINLSTITLTLSISQRLSGLAIYIAYILIPDCVWVTFFQHRWRKWFFFHSLKGSLPRWTISNTNHSFVLRTQFYKTWLTIILDLL